MHASITRWGGAAVLAATVAITGTACSSAPAAPTAASHASQSAPAVAAPAVTPDAPSAMDTWCAGSGATDEQAVKTDLTQMSADAGNDDITAVEADGAQLESDATDAGSNPPPVSNAQQAIYTQAMESLMTAGMDAGTGDLTAATSALTIGTGYLTQDAGILPAGCS